jgi:hypothetical protein
MSVRCMSGFATNDTKLTDVSLGLDGQRDRSIG